MQAPQTERSLHGATLAVHEFLEGVGVAAFGGIEQVECVFDGECGQLSLGIFEYGEWSGERVGDGDFGIDDCIIVFGLEFGDGSGSGFQQAAVLGGGRGGCFGAAEGDKEAGNDEREPGLAELH